MFDIHAEYDGFSKAVAALEKLGDLFRHQPPTFLNDDGFVEVLPIIYPILDDMPVLVFEALRWTPSLGVDVERDFDDLIGREKAIVDTMFERVGVKGIAEVFGTGHLGGLFGGCREANV